MWEVTRTGKRSLLPSANEASAGIPKLASCHLVAPSRRSTERKGVTEHRIRGRWPRAHLLRDSKAWLAVALEELAAKRSEIVEGLPAGCAFGGNQAPRRLG
jgi:hypothetical protein